MIQNNFQRTSRRGKERSAGERVPLTENSKNRAPQDCFSGYEMGIEEWIESRHDIVGLKEIYVKGKDYLVCSAGLKRRGWLAKREQ